MAAWRCRLIFSTHFLRHVCRQNSSSMTNKRILFISQEIAPYLPSSPLSSLGKNLPQTMQEKGYEVRTFMPKFGAVNERRNQLHEVIRLSGMNIIIDDNDHPLIIKVASLQPSRIQVYFIENDDFFKNLMKMKMLWAAIAPTTMNALFFSQGAPWKQQRNCDGILKSCIVQDGLQPSCLCI